MLHARVRGACAWSVCASSMLPFCTACHLKSVDKGGVLVQAELATSKGHGSSTVLLCTHRTSQSSTHLQW